MRENLVGAVSEADAAQVAGEGPATPRMTPTPSSDAATTAPPFPPDAALAPYRAG